jgi:hypothetical protein
MTMLTIPTIDHPKPPVFDDDHLSLFRFASYQTTKAR